MISASATMATGTSSTTEATTTATTTGVAKTHTTSPMSTKPHDEELTMASGLVLDHFGPTVQSVFDCLAMKGQLPFLGILACMKKRCSKIENVDRTAVVNSAQRANSGLSFTSQAAADSEMVGYVVEETTIKAALLVLINHGIVKATWVDGQRGASFEYEALKEMGTRLSRYDRYCQHVKGCYEGLDPDEFDVKKRLPGIIVKAVLCKGMMRTEEIVDYCAEQALLERCREEKMEEIEEAESDKILKSNRMECVKVLVDLVASHIIQDAPTCGPGHDGDGDDDNDDDDDGTDKKRKKIHIQPDDEEVVSLVKGNKKLPEGSVWVVNWKYLDERLKCEKVGLHVYECTEIEGSQEVVTAALFHCARQIQEGKPDSRYIFRPEDVCRVMKSEPGLMIPNMKASVSEVLEMLHREHEAKICRRKADEGSYELLAKRIVKEIRDINIQTMILDRWGENAARIFSILRENNKFLNDVYLSTVAMVPEKETRVMLHILYQNRLVQFHDFPITKQHAYNTTSYLWKTDDKALYASVIDMLRRAYINLRDRRRVYVLSAQAIFDRLLAKQRDGYSGEKKEGDAQEEKEARENLALIDYGMNCLDDDLVLFGFNPFGSVDLDLKGTML